MDIAVKSQIGQAAFPLLAPFHEFDGYPLQAVRETFVLDELAGLELEFACGCLLIDVDPEDDTIQFSFSKERRLTGHLANDVAPWAQQIGKSIGWGWVSVNQQGYLDGISLSFGSILPQFSITAAASSLHLSESLSVNRKAASRQVHSAA